MIRLTRLDGMEFLLSAHQIETVETTPDTILTLVSGRKFIVRESAAEIAERAVDYYRKIGLPALTEQPVESMGRSK